MTALSVALVLCCAMVCGTVLTFRWLALKERRAEVAIRDDVALHQRLDALEQASHVHVDERIAMKRELEQLRAQVALRSM